MLIGERFVLPTEFKTELRQRTPPWGYGAFSEAVYYRSYSRTTPDGRQETWADTIIRVVEGVFSIRKDWYRRQGLRWERRKWDAIAREMAEYMFAMKMLPPGRGLWAMGTNHVFERGSAALLNCGFVSVTDSLASSAVWMIDMLMNGIGIGCDTHNATFGEFYIPGPRTVAYQIPDSREGWAESIRRLIESYEREGRRMVEFDCSLIRPAGSLIRGFGGVASGPEPLIELHDRLRQYLGAYTHRGVDRTRLIADTMNAIGVCVVSGNVRRSAELMLGSITDQTFLDLKNYTLHSDRAEVGWMANNSVVLRTGEDFDLLPTITDRIRDNGEPGIVNMINIQKYARFGKKKPDVAIGMNPCCEIPLEDKGVCNLAEIFPTLCTSVNELFRAMELAVLYTSTVTLLPTHRTETNRVITKSRRTGVSISGIADWLDATSWSKVTRILRRGYEEHVEPMNIALAEEAGIPPSVRLTTVKPSGTTSLLAGTSPGMHWPIYRHYIRRMRVGEGSPVAERLIKAKVPHEPDAHSRNTLVFEFPLEAGNGKTRSVSEVSVWEQASLVAMLQREWSDNSVSSTLTFSPSKEGDQVERVISCFAPLVKSLSLLPDQSEQKSYEQAPYEAIDQQEYRKRAKAMKEIDWQGFGGSDGQDNRYCDSDVCENSA